MKRKTKNISMFFAHAISLLLCAIVIIVSGCAGIQTTSPEEGKASEVPLMTDSTLVEKEKTAVAEPEPLLTEEALMAEETVLISGNQKSGDQTNPAHKESALVNRIEFSGLPEGRSVITVGTTRPIRYELKEMSDKKVILQLLDTRLPEQHKRPLITNRFDSAVDKILPIQTTSMKDAIITIELREKVGFQPQQTDNLLQIHFEASSISPKSLDEAGLPSWQRMISEPLEDPISPSAQMSAGTRLSPIAKNMVQETEIPDAILGMETVGSGKTYTGEKIALDFFETDIRNVFRILREVSGKNFAIDRDVTGTVTLTLEKPVPWDQILDLILKMNQLGKVEEADVIRIARMETITKEQKDRQDQIAARAKLLEEEKAVEPLVTEYFPINYSEAERDILPKLQLISTRDRGIITVDTRTNMVIMTDTADKIKHAREIIQRLDMVTPQVIIEARIVEVTSDFSKEIGIQWDMASEQGRVIRGPWMGASNPLQYGVPGSHAIDWRRNQPDPTIQRNFSSGERIDSSRLGGQWGYDTAVNLPVLNPAGSIGFQFSRIFGSPLVIDARLSALESKGEGKIVSSPKIMTLNNKKAVIKQGREIPYSVIGSDGMVQTQFKEVDLRLEVTPVVTPDDRVTLNVLVAKDEVAEFSVDGIPSLSTKRAETELLVNDGETIVIGGILLSSEQESTDSVPVLGKLPVLKWLFKKDGNFSRKEELLIFLTPRIMRLEQKNMLSYQN